ncbi:hypothetical protein EV178_003924, partial [Coemansia sp. RSA 1646]
EEFDRARQKSQGRFRSAFQAIFKKYGQIDEEDDIIDLKTGEFIVDNGRVRNSRIIELGDLLRYSDQPSSPSLGNNGQSHRQASPESKGVYHLNHSQPSSPELFSNEQLEQKRSSNRRDIDVRHGSYRDAHDSEKDELSQVSDNDTGSIDLDFASYITKHESTAANFTSFGPLWKRRRKASSDEDEESIDYDSSDSLAADQETTSIDMYFTNSIEHYLEKLRQQLSAPQTTRNYSSPPSTDQIYDIGNSDNSIVVPSGHKVLRNYEIPSSPHTMTPRSSGYSVHTQSMAGSPISSVYSGEYEAISESSIRSSAQSLYSLPSDTVAAEQPVPFDRKNGLSFDNERHHSIRIGFSNGHEVEEESDGPISEEEPIETLNVYRNSERYGYFPDASPMLFPLDQQNADLELNSSPVLRRPQPVAPHIFFSRDISLDSEDGLIPDSHTEIMWLPNDKEQHYMSFQKHSTSDLAHESIDSDDDASIHSVEQAIRELGINGTGIKIGIVDSGVDYTHPELGNCWKTKGCPWQFGADFIGDKYNASSSSPIIDPNPTPMDCDGHGTHVSGIIAAQGPKVRGVAPGATFGMYRVFSCPIDGNVYSSDDIILEGIEAAYKDGHAIISLSLGGGSWPEDPLAVACSRLVDKGVIVVAANGNDGSSGLFTAGSPAVGKGVISVGSVDNWNITGHTATFSMQNNTRLVLLSMPGSALNPFVFESPVTVVALVDSSGNNEGCNSTSTDLAGKIALVKRGTCTFTEKALNAQEAGAVGIVIYNDVAGTLSPSVNSSVTIPAVIISRSDGIALESGVLQGGSTMVAQKSAFGTFPADTGGMMSTFSSYGPTPELGIAPLVSAPGGNIWSTYPLKLGGFATLSGTSMATPFVSGVAALLKQAQPNLSSADIRDILVESSQPLWDNSTGRNIHPYHSGVGLINAYHAATARAKFSPSTISINGSDWNFASNVNDYQSGSYLQWTIREVEVRNFDSIHGMHVWFENGGVSDSLSMYMPNGSLALSPQIWPGDSSYRAEGPESTTDPNVITPNVAEYVGPGKASQLTIKITAPTGLRHMESWYYGGVLNFTVQWDGNTKKRRYYVPYAGFAGNYRKTDVLAPSSSGFPAITDMEKQLIDNLEQFIVSANSTALLVYSLIIPSRVVTATMIDNTNRSLGYLPYGYVEYATRNHLGGSNPSSVAVINGTVFTDKEATLPIAIPAGQYHVRLAALRPLGDASNNVDYQVWDSPKFRIE